MRKILMSLLLGCILFSNISFANPIVYEKPDVKIIVEGTELQLDSEVPIIVNSRTLVPLRKLLVGLGVPDNTENIQWIGEQRAVKVIYNGVNIDLAIDSAKAYINGTEYTLDSVPIIHRDRTYLPARFVGEALGYTISWDQYTPAVLVTSNKNMDKLTEILNDLKTAMNNVNSYEIITVRNSNIESTYNGNVETSSHTITNIEKADLDKKIIYTENSYTDDYENSFTFSYYTPATCYSCYKYLEDDTLYNAGWEKYSYDAEIDDVTPFEGKEKLGVINVEDSLYGALTLTEYKNVYLVSSVSNQIDLLKFLDGKYLYDEVSDSDSVKDFKFELAIDKETKLPVELKVNFETIYQDVDTDYNFSSIEKNEYIISFKEYNQYLKLELPNI